jgi:hypothetical protein
MTPKREAGFLTRQSLTEASAMKRRILVSLIVFLLFSLLGPLMRLVFPRTISAGHFGSVIDDVIFYIWPTTVLGVGPGIGRQATIELVEANMLFFLIFGFLVGLSSWRAWVAAVLYVLTCATIIFVEAWGFRSSLGFFTWCSLVTVFLLYAIPFWAVGRAAKYGLTARGSTA